MGRGPLVGVRVLDLSRVLAAPYATMALGEMGADVIKVERFPGGDETRQWGPPFADGESTYFLGINRNKRSIALDLSQRGDQSIVRDLALKWADVVVENFRPGTLERWDLGLSDLRTSSPRLVTASVRGYPGSDTRPGYDFVIQAGTGLMSITGPEDGPPTKVGIAVSDIITGLFLVSGIEAALYRRERMGRGDHVEVSLWGSQLAALATVVQGYTATGEEPRRWGNAHAQLAPYAAFPTRDGLIAIGVGNDRQFTRLSEVLGHAEWSEDPRFSTNPERVRNRQSLHAVMDRVLACDSTASWVARLSQAGVPCGPVRSVPEALADAERQGHAVMGAVDHSRLGALRQVRMPWAFSESEVAMGAAPPLLDEHREEILALVEGLRHDGRVARQEHE